MGCPSETARSGYSRSTINSRPVDRSANAPGITYDSTNQVYLISPPNQLGVFKKLAARNGGEVISAESYRAARRGNLAVAPFQGP